MRVSKATPAEPQEAALRADGLADFSETGDVWRDDEPRRRAAVPDLPWRARAITGCRPGDEVVIASLEVWSPSLADGIAALNDLAAKGGVLRVLNPPTTYEGGPALATAVDFVRAMERAVNAAKTRPANEAAARKRVTRADKDTKRRKEAREVWLDQNLTAEEAAERTGYSVRSMYRWWGNRTPLAPTRRVARPRR